MRTLYESLLDDEEDVLDDDTLIIDEFMKQINHEYKDLFDKNLWKDDVFTYNKNEKLLNIDLPYTQRFNISHDIKKLFDKSGGVIKFDTISFNNRYQGNNMGGRVSEVFFKWPEVSNNTLAPILNFNNIHFINLSDCHTCKNIELNITTKDWVKVFTPEWKGDYSNLTINMNCPKQKILSIGTDFGKIIPDLSWITSNATDLRIYDCSLFDSETNDACNKMAKIIDLNEPIFIYDKKLDKYIEKKYTIQKLIAAANNVKRYIFAKDYQFKLTKNANITKTLGLKNIKNLNYIRIVNNNAGFILSKNEAELKKMVIKHFGYADNINIPQTNDGWYVVLVKRN